MRRVLVTGASGFIARHLIQALACSGDVHVVALTRSPDTIGREGRYVEVVRGSVLDTDRYEPLLPDIDAVIHLAAMTGKATLRAFDEVNVGGTARLVAACQAAGSRPILHVSTIAVRYPNVDRYPYAQSKQRAEEIVRGSGLPFTILRPTIVLGRDSAAWHSFSTLIRPSLVIVPGSGRAAVQPLHVDDLAALMATLIRASSFDGKTHDVGGSEELTVKTFLERAHAACYGDTARFVHLPLSVLLPVLRLGEKLAFSLMPATAGQFSVFRFDSTAGESDLTNGLFPSMRPVESMLADLCT